MSLVVLDAGHGGSDPGAVNNNRYEKNDALRLALAVGRILDNCGIRVLQTRLTDVLLSLDQRSLIANSNNATLFVSIHRNSSVNLEAHGFEIHVGLNASQVALALADNVLRRVVAVGVQANRGILRSNFAVLRNTNAPAILIEANFISNARDNQLFDSSFEGYANAIAQGIAVTLGVDCGSMIAVPPPITVPPVSPIVPPSDIIFQIQRTLNTRYNTNLNVDGVWGQHSQRAVIIGLQRELNSSFGSGLIVDGIWGARTQAALPLIRQGSRGNIVYLIQAMLVVAGYNVLLDGIFGVGTESAVRQFQRDRGLVADGIVGKNTAARLFG